MRWPCWRDAPSLRQSGCDAAGESQAHARLLEHRPCGLSAGRGRERRDHDRDIRKCWDCIAFYLAGYLLMTLLSFLVMIVVANHSRGDDILHFNGSRQTQPIPRFRHVDRRCFRSRAFRSPPDLLASFSSSRRRCRSTLRARRPRRRHCGSRFLLSTCALLPRCIGRSQTMTRRFAFDFLRGYNWYADCSLIVAAGVFPQPILSMLTQRHLLRCPAPPLRGKRALTSRHRARRSNRRNRGNGASCHADGCRR